MEVRFGFGTIGEAISAVMKKATRLRELRQLPVYHLSRQVAENGKFLGLYNPKQIFPKARLGCEALALIEYQNKKAFYMCSLKRAKEIWDE